MKLFQEEIKMRIKVICIENGKGQNKSVEIGTFGKDGKFRKVELEN